ncbi:MAG TPA: peptidylprolyl isomerase [candidate division Zixibacteria bacterium]|nr:peptidylprolyl isomerase [candidate division Zixibacteria bacterium]
MKIRHILFGAMALIMFAFPARAQRQTVDKIVAVVGDQVILASELASQVQLAILQSGQQPSSQAELDTLKNDLLNQMISDRLFLIAAKKDTSIKLRDEEIEQALDDQVARVAKNFDTYDDFLNALSNEGLTLRELKKKYRPEIENQLLKERYEQKQLYTVSVSRHEVEEFYAQNKDSIPNQPEAVKLAHILLAIEPSQHVEDSVKELATELRQKVLDGADFATISSRYSTGGAGANGGELGYVAKEDMVPEFARAAFNLNVGDISGVIRTQFGYHVIKNEGQKGQKLKLRHILLAVNPSPSDSERVLHLADSLLQAARNGGDFAQMAKIFSADSQTRAEGGELGWFAVGQLPAEFVDTVKGWTTPGTYRGPVMTKYGLHILKLLDYQPEKVYTLPDDFDQIKELARQDKTGKMVQKWIEQLKEKTYIKEELD